MQRLTGSKNNCIGISVNLCGFGAFEEEQLEKVYGTPHRGTIPTSDSLEGSTGVANTNLVYSPG